MKNLYKPFSGLFLELNQYHKIYRVSFLYDTLYCNQGKNYRIFGAFALPAELLLIYDREGRNRTCDPMINNRSMILKRHLIFFKLF
jgi:hypothetical protein